MKVKSESEVAQSCPIPSDPMDCSLPGSSVHGFSRQEYWSGVPLPSLVTSLEDDKSRNMQDYVRLKGFCMVKKTSNKTEKQAAE